MNTRLSPARTLGILAISALRAAPSFAQKITTAAVTDITFNGLPNSVDVHLKECRTAPRSPMSTCSH